MDLSRLYQLINEAQDNVPNETVLFDGKPEWDFQVILQQTKEGYCVISKVAGEIVDETSIHEFATDAIKEYIEFCKQEDTMSDLFFDMLYDQSNFNIGNSAEAIYLLDKIKELTKDVEDTDKGIPCVILIEDIGNCFAFIKLVEKNTELKSQYDVEVEYQDEELEPTLQYVLAYYKDGEFYNEQGEDLQLEDINVDLNEAFLTKQDKQILLNIGHKEEDLDQIQQAADKRKTTYTINDKPATREEVIKLLGREKYLYGLSRSAFHYTASQTQDGKEVGFDSSKLFESEEV